jgi:TonB-dependent receptor
MIRLLAGASLLSLAVSASAFAADDAEANAGAPEIVVTGTRPIAESEAAALEIQKKSDSLVTVISSDSVGRLPDQNIAQATSRLPGLAVESDQGQPRYISIRGAPKSWTTLSFDGINVVSPEGRDARFDSVPSAIASKIIVSKAVTPDMPGETVAGNVNVITRSAFDYSGFHLAGKAGYGVAEYSSRPQYEGSLVASTRIPAGDGEIGILVSGSYFQRAMITDNFENDWETVDQDRQAGWENRVWAAESENKLYRLTRRNWSVSGRLDWKPDANNTISLRSIYTIFKDDEARDNYRFDMDDKQSSLSNSSAACPAVPAAQTTSGYADVCGGNSPLQGTIYGIDIRQRSTLRAFRQSIFTNTIEGDHKFGDGWTLNWLGNYTQSKDDRSVVGEATWDSPSTLTARPTVAYDFSDPQRSRLILYTTLQSGGVLSAGTRVTAIDQFNKPLSGFSILDAVDTTNAYTGRLVVSKETSFLGADATFKAGFQFDQRRKTVVENALALSAAQAGTIMPTDYNQFSLDRGFMGKIEMGYTFRYFDLDKMRAAAAAARAQFGNLFAPATGNIYDVQEQIYAGYLMGTLRYDWGSIVGGVRLEHIKNRGTAVGTIGATTGLVTAESSQTLAFPSLHVNYDLDDTKKLRLSFNTGAARADYDQMRPNVVVNDTNETISGGNPGIKPERAWGLDAYFEWYVRPQGYFMVGAFYKKVTDVLYTTRRTFGSTALNSNGIDRSGYAYSGIVNGGDGRIYGLEAAAQFQLEPWTHKLGLPGWMGGFGISANITLNNSEVTKPAVVGAGNVITANARKVRLPNTSDVVFNVGPYYEKYGLSLKLQYQRRSKWLDAIADQSTDGGDAYWGTDDEMDFSARYAINKNFEIYFDATNLLNRPGRRLIEPAGVIAAEPGKIAVGNPGYTIEWERFGRRYSGGVRFTF